jgi:tetratricopeptide (TPR) repeat protein
MHFFFFSRNFRKSALACGIFSLLSGCQNQNTNDAEATQGPVLMSVLEEKKSAEVKKNPGSAIEKTVAQLNGKLPACFALKQFAKFVKEGDLQSASRVVNLALKAEPRHAGLHLLNGFVYEARLASGETQCAEMTESAYNSAYRLDPSQWIVCYALGSYYMGKDRYDLAQKYLADALILKPKDANTLYGLAYASYYLQDLPVALSSIGQFVKQQPQSSEGQKAAAIILAAAGQFPQAQQALDRFKELVNNLDQYEVSVVEKRIEDWKMAHSERMTAKVAGDSDLASVQKKQESAKLNAEAPIIVFDCCHMRSGERDEPTRGNNIMSFLEIASVTGSINPLQRVIFSEQKGGLKPEKSSWTKAFKFNAQNSAINYSLQIANSDTELIEVVSRPTISTVLGRPAFFVDGTNYAGAAAGASGSSVASVDTGIRIELTPLEVLPDGRLVLEIAIAGSVFLLLPVLDKKVVGQMVGKNNSNISCTVYVAFGETIVLGGSFDRFYGKTRSEFPVLGSIPILQYFFASDSVTSQISSTLYMVTPRRGGGFEELAEKANAKKVKNHSEVEKTLKKRGLFSMGEYPNLYYIMKSLGQSPFIRDFRSGDLPRPFWGFSNASLDDKLSMLSRFLFF